MDYYFRKGADDAPKFLMLHGTGGDELSIAALAEWLTEENEASTILSFRGNVKEDGMNRFFRRNGLNQFDYDSLEEETDTLYEEIKRVSAEKGITVSDWVIVGYSNGANIAAHMMLERTTDLRKAILFHPMSLGRHTQTFSLKGKEIWLSYGMEDPIVSEESMLELATTFQQREAEVGVYPMESGHQIMQEEVHSAAEWLKDKKTEK